jgi:hypothetical protein
MPAGPGAGVPSRLLGAHGLEGLDLPVDLGRKELVPARPVPAAAVAQHQSDARHFTAAASS